MVVSHLHIVLFCHSDCDVFFIYFCLQETARDSPDPEKSEGDDYEVVNSKEMGRLCNIVKLSHNYHY